MWPGPSRRKYLHYIPKRTQNVALEPMRKSRLRRTKDVVLTRFSVTFSILLSLRVPARQSVDQAFDAKSAKAGYLVIRQL